MKKILLLALALIMALSVAGSALAFTSTPWNADTQAQFYVAIRLIEASDGPLGISFSAPAVNRGYLKNEIVCAIATLHVPANQDVAGRGYQYLAFGGRNVSLNVMENYKSGAVALTVSTNIPSANQVFSEGPGGLSASNEIRFSAANIPANISSVQQYHFAFFGKVLDDNAYMNVLLTKAKEFTTPQAGSPEETFVTNIGLNSTTTHQLFDEEYHVFRTIIDDKVYYTVVNLALDKVLFQVTTTKSNKSDGMYVYHLDTKKWYEVVDMGTGRPAFRLADGSDFLMESDTGDRKTRYNYLINIYDDIIKAEFGMDIKYKGNSLSEKYFNDHGNVNDAFSEIAIEPWYVEVNVPPEIEITPPKTGDKLSELGFILILTAAAASLIARSFKVKEEN